MNQPMTLKQIDERIVRVSQNYPLGWMSKAPLVQTVTMLMCEAAGIDSDQVASDERFKQIFCQDDPNAADPQDTAWRLAQHKIGWDAALNWQRERKDKA